MKKNRSVEHFIPCHLSTPEKNYDLDWQNMLGVCLPPGGLKNDDSGKQDENLPNSSLPHNFPCCGKAKDNFVPDGRLLNPLELPILRLSIVRTVSEEELETIDFPLVAIPIEKLVTFILPSVV